MTDVAEDLATAYQAKLNKIGPGAVWIQLGLMTAVGSSALILFSVLRPKNSVIYQPKVKYSEDGKRPPTIARGTFSWVKPILTTHESTLMDNVGLDAVAFLRFLKMGRNMFLAVAALSCAVLIPVNLVYNLNDKKASNKDSRTYLTMITIQAVTGSWLYVHVAVTYVLTLICLYFIWSNYAQLVRLKWQWFRSEEYQNSLNSRSIIITQVAKPSRSDAGIASLLSSLQIPYPTTAVHIGRKVGLLPELIEAHNAAVRSLEGVLTTYFKDPNRLPTKRPTMRMGGGSGCCGGKKVDAIDYLTEKIKRYEQRIEETRHQIDEKKAENYGFASFESVPYAHLVARKLHGRRKKGAHFDLAPLPKDIIWDNLSMLDSQRSRSKFFGAILLVGFMILYIIPLVGVSVLANLAALSSYVGFINTWNNKYPLLMSAFVGVVPPLLSVLLQLLLPIVIRWISSYQGATTHSHSDRVVAARYSAFLFISQFFIFSLIGVIIQLVLRVVALIEGNKATAENLWEAFKSVPANVQSTWIIQSTYWLTVFPLRGASALFDLAQVVSLLFVWGKTKLFGRTPREIREWTTPPMFDYAVYYSNHLYMMVVGLVYAPLAPLVPLFAASAFCISYYVYKYQLMYVSISRVETGGRLWRVAINRMLWALVTMQLVMVLTIGLQRGWYNAIAVAPPIVFVLIFKIVLMRKFDAPYDWFIPGEAEMAEVHLHQADARKHRLQKRFGHPSMHEPLFTPMLHKSVQHLLPTIYNGRIGESRGAVDGKAVEQNIAGGLTFNMLEEHDLQYDRTAYLRQRDEDAMTVTTAYAGAKSEAGPGDDYFNQRRREYLKHGVMGSGSPMQTPGTDDLPYELSRMPTAESQENLIQYPPRYGSPSPLPMQSPPQHQSPPGPARRNQSIDSLTGMAIVHPNYGPGREAIEMQAQTPQGGYYGARSGSAGSNQSYGGSGFGGGAGAPPGRFDPRAGAQGRFPHQHTQSNLSQNSNSFEGGYGQAYPPRVTSPPQQPHYAQQHARNGSLGGQAGYSPVAPDEEFRR
ncbi:DUF221-domain-containing protein [Meredithblackwellia eburnea MCA 4105]